MKRIVFSLTVASFLATSWFCHGDGSAPSFEQRSTRDDRVREYVLPARVLWQSPMEACSIKNAEQLLQPFSGQITLEHGETCVMANNGNPPGILLDFGGELHGGIQLAIADLKASSTNSKSVRVRVRFGESASEAMSELGGDPNATNDHAVRDQTVLLPWLGTAEIGNTGFRFARIDLLDPKTFVAFKSVRAIYLHRKLHRIGSFKCNDERLNQIWETGSHTVFLNMQDYVWDGIKRDRLVWIGDMHPETSTIEAVFGSEPVVNASLDLIRDQTPTPNWMNGISSYSMWWIIIQRDWFQHNGDLAYVRQQQEYLLRLLNQLSLFIGADGAEKLPAMRFLDWPSSENPKAIHAGLQSLMILACQAGGDLAAALNDKETQARCANAVSKLRKHVPDHGNSKQAAALMALAGLADPAKLNHEVMAVDGAKRISTFYGFYVLQARAKAGDYQGCLDTIRQYWGAMLDLGATTFWEDFNLDWVPNAGRIDELVPAGKTDIHATYGGYSYKGFRNSLCHGWASGPTAWLSQQVLGVQIVEPGCRTVRIEPHLGDLEWAEGTFPTPKGPIKIRHEKHNGKITSTIDAPAGVTVIRG
jgi:alpha-L-rhamnosidase